MPQIHMIVLGNYQNLMHEMARSSSFVDKVAQCRKMLAEGEEKFKASPLVKSKKTSAEVFSSPEAPLIYKTSVNYDIIAATLVCIFIVFFLYIFFFNSFTCLKFTNCHTDMFH